MWRRPKTPLRTSTGGISTLGLQELKEQVSDFSSQPGEYPLLRATSCKFSRHSRGEEAAIVDTRVLNLTTVLSISFSFYRVPVQAGAVPRVGVLAACFPTITTLMVPQEASLKTSLARMVLCGEVPMNLGFYPHTHISGSWDRRSGAAQG